MSVQNREQCNSHEYLGPSQLQEPTERLKKFQKHNRKKIVYWFAGFFRKFTYVNKTRGQKPTLVNPKRAVLVTPYIAMDVGG